MVREYSLVPPLKLLDNSGSQPYFLWDPSLNVSPPQCIELLGRIELLSNCSFHETMKNIPSIPCFFYSVKLRPATCADYFFAVSSKSSFISLQVMGLIPVPFGCH